MEPPAISKSINSEDIACLEQIQLATPRGPELLIAEARALYGRVGRKLPDLVSEGKEEGRVWGSSYRRPIS